MELGDLWIFVNYRSLNSMEISIIVWDSAGEILCGPGCEVHFQDEHSRVYKQKFVVSRQQYTSSRQTITLKTVLLL